MPDLAAHPLAQRSSSPGNAYSGGSTHHLYVHVPFCARRCSYCDFSIAVRSRVPVGEYVTALETEFQALAPGSWLLNTVYLGGGTPSRLGGSGIAQVLSLVHSRARVTPGAEVTLEANPDDVSPAAAAAWREAGVNRVSLGAQSFDPHVLRWMHRGHSPAQIGKAVDILRSEGISNISLDLIFAVPEQLGRSWSADLEATLALAPSHVSLYGLTVEPHTPLARWRERGDAVEAPDERYEAEFLAAHSALRAAGMEHYEISNFGRAGLHSRHNSAYWSGAPYAGIGPSAHSYDGVVRRWNVSPYAEWVRRLRTGAEVAVGEEVLSAENRAAERVYLGLRTAQGLAASDAELDVARPWIAAGWARVDHRRIALTPLGMLRLDALAVALARA